MSAKSIPIWQYCAEIKTPYFFNYKRLLHGNPNLDTKDYKQFLDVDILATKKHYQFQELKK